MPTAISRGAPLTQRYDPELNPDEGAGGASSVGYEGGSGGAGNLPPSRPPDRTDDRCFLEQVRAALSCGKLVRGFDLLQAATCVLQVSNLASCLTARAETPEP